LSLSHELTLFIAFDRHQAAIRSHMSHKFSPLGRGRNRVYFSTYLCGVMCHHGPPSSGQAAVMSCRLPCLADHRCKHDSARCAVPMRLRGACLRALFTGTRAPSALISCSRGRNFGLCILLPYSSYYIRYAGQQITIPSGCVSNNTLTADGSASSGGAPPFTSIEITNTTSTSSSSPNGLAGSEKEFVGLCVIVLL